MYNKAKANQLLGSLKHYQITGRTCAATEGMEGLLQEAMNNGASRPVGGGGEAVPFHRATTNSYRSALAFPEGSDLSYSHNVRLSIGHPWREPF
jgi:hypothetical protein